MAGVILIAVLTLTKLYHATQRVDDRPKHRPSEGQHQEQAIETAPCVRAQGHVPFSSSATLANTSLPMPAESAPNSGAYFSRPDRVRPLTSSIHTIEFPASKRPSRKRERASSPDTVRLTRQTKLALQKQGGYATLVGGHQIRRPEYCQTRWGWTRRNADKYVEAAEYVEAQSENYSSQIFTRNQALTSRSISGIISHSPCLNLSQISAMTSKCVCARPSLSLALSNGWTMPHHSQNCRLQGISTICIVQNAKGRR